MLLKIRSLIDKLKHKDKWKLMIHIKGIHVKTLYVEESEAPLVKVYVINIWFRKYLLGSNYMKVAIAPKKMILHNNDKRETHVEAIIYGGVDL